MDLFLTILLFALGIVFIVKGGDYFVDASSWIAEVSGIPKLIVGATIVSVATTLPEMIVSVMAALEGKVEMSVGNAVGSVTANLGLIMAIAVIFMPGVIKRKDFLLKSILMIAASTIIVACGFVKHVNILLSILLLLIFVGFIFENVSSARKNMIEESILAAKGEIVIEKPAKDKKTVIVNIIKFILGVAGIVIGARLLVDEGSELARAIGISERIIGVTIIAVGTSLPELVTTITAIIKKQSDLSVGNIIGANIMDLALIMPLSSIISGKPLPISQNSAIVDLPACLIVGILAVVPALISSKFKRWQGFVLLGVYTFYLGITCFVLK